MVQTLSYPKGYYGMSNTIKPKGRQAREKVLKPYGIHLVYAEGEKTEPLYVSNIDQKIQENKKDKNSSIKIEVNPKSGGRSTLSLIEFAERDVIKRRRKKEVIDHIWIFYDKDSFIQDDYDNAFHKINSKNKKTHINEDGDITDSYGTRWHACWSNESFELWILLHFANVQSSLSRQDYITKINGHLKSKKLTYEKNLNCLYDVVCKHGDVKNAIKYAKCLDLELGNPLKKDNPSTGVYLFVEYFKLFLKI